MIQIRNRKVQRCQKRFKNLIAFALHKGWKVTITRHGHLKIILCSGACIFTTSIDEQQKPKSWGTL